MREADNLTAICETIVSTMWHPQHLTTLQDFTAGYSVSPTLPYTVMLFLRISRHAI
jgi:hypothetical protein